MYPPGKAPEFTISEALAPRTWPAARDPRLCTARFRLTRCVVAAVLRHQRAMSVSSIPRLRYNQVVPGAVAPVR